MKNIYLPNLSSIKIDNYSLYYNCPSFEFNFLDGISAIIGGNGIGKTTFVEIIIYCLVGHKRTYPVLGKKKTKTKEKIENVDFFKSRMNENYPHNKNKEAQAYLKFEINEHSIVVGRSLYENKVIYLEVNNKNILQPNEEIYNDTILHLTGLSTFKSLDKLVRTFLFFDEKRENIAWEADTQDEILRILFYEEEFYTQFQTLEEEVTYWDTTGRHLSEDRRIEKGSYEELIKSRDQLFENLDLADEEEMLNIYDTKNNLEKESQELKVELEEFIEMYSRYEQHRNLIIGEKNEVLLNLQKLTNDISKMESGLYKNLYNNLPDFYVSLERVMVNEGKCVACGTKTKKIKEKAIQLKHNKACLICSSEIEIKEEMDPNVIEKINHLYSKKSELDNKVENKDETINGLKEKINENSTLLNRTKGMLSSKQREIIYLDTIISKHNIEKGMDTFSQILDLKQKNIDKYDEKIASAYKKRDEIRKEIVGLHRSFSKVIYGLNQHLSKYFNKYASTFIGLNCELTVKDKVINRIPHIVYIPKIDGSDRNDIHSVSESQRFFLDQAFRMAIIDYLQSTVSGFKTFFITETPEGSLDIAYESKVAEMFILFSKSLNNIIFTSNLNSSRFLLKIYEELSTDERRKRTLNLLEKGRPTKFQKNNEDFIRIQKELFGSDY